MDTMYYQHKSIEHKWQKHWDVNKTFNTKEVLSKPKYYILGMFPYPSGQIHMGHLRNYSIVDVIARLKRAQGYNVLNPIGWDAFGLPAENAAIKNNMHPAQWTVENIQLMKAQLQSLGLSYDWSREINTCSPDYYKHEQQMFIDFYKIGLIYQKYAEVNWDPVDMTVLANEQVIDGKGWRSGAYIERKQLKQWFFKITAFAEELLDDLSRLNGWPEKVRIMQEKWIGKSEGTRIVFSILQNNNHSKTKEIDIYTTRPETLFGASFISVAYNHPIVSELAQGEALKTFLAVCKSIATTEEAAAKIEKIGFNTGLQVIHPLDSSITLPLYISNCIIMDYGTGAIFGCPAHDIRDHAFAIKYGLPIKQVIAPAYGTQVDVHSKPFLEDGVLINSGFINGMTVSEARNTIIQELESQSIGIRHTNYRLRDWGISRQRYWGCPIPIVHCDICGAVPVHEKDLPITLPQDVTFSLTGNPLVHHLTWKHTKCPQCNADALRDTDTLDTFFESSWYFLRFCSPHYKHAIQKSVVDYWLPVDQYIGGVEHAVLHLLYARFFTYALQKLGYINTPNHFAKVFTQGMVCHETYQSQDNTWLFPYEVKKVAADQAIEIATNKPVTIGRAKKMSKSTKNVVEPERIIKQYGADTARLFLLSDSPPERDLEWHSTGVDSAYRYLCKLAKMVEQALRHEECPHNDAAEQNLLKLMHQTVHAVTEDLEQFRLNRAIARIREFNNALIQSKIRGPVYKQAIEIIIQLFYPIVPHFSEEMWERLGHTEKLTATPWPIADCNFIQNTTSVIAIQINGKLKSTMSLPMDCPQHEVERQMYKIDTIKHFLDGKSIKKVIYIPNKIISIVCS